MSNKQWKEGASHCGFTETPDKAMPQAVRLSGENSRRLREVQLKVESGEQAASFYPIGALQTRDV